MTVVPFRPRFDRECALAEDRAFGLLHRADTPALRLALSRAFQELAAIRVFAADPARGRPRLDRVTRELRAITRAVEAGAADVIYSANDPPLPDETP